MIEKGGLDLVVIATPDDKHMNTGLMKFASRYALEKGMHVFVEKPVATTIYDLKIFRDLANEFNSEKQTKLHFGEKYSHAKPVQATIQHRKALGEFKGRSTHYIMWNCDRIMGNGKWRTTTPFYNPVAGGLSHNFMTAVLLAGEPITHIRARGDVKTYKELEETRGYDYMSGTLLFDSGKSLEFIVDLSVKDKNCAYGHRTIRHDFQFTNGNLMYGTIPESDLLIVNGERIPFEQEQNAESWREYNQQLYTAMHKETLAAIKGKKPLHTIEQGINVALACVKAFESARSDFNWKYVNP